MVRMVLALTAAFLLNACATGPAGGPPGDDRVAVVVDPRIELMSVVQLLSGYPLVTGFDPAYKQRARARFAPWRDHQAVTMFKAMSRQDFAFSNVPEALLAFTPPPALQPRRPLSSGVVRSAGGERQLGQFMAAMRDFHASSGFGRFFEAEQPFYRQLVSRTRPRVDRVVSRLEAYLGSSLGDATVVLGPLLHDGGFLAGYRNGSGDPEIYAFIGPSSVAQGFPDFGTPERLDTLITHEFAHSVINPLTARHRGEVRARMHLHESVRGRMLERGYDQWDTIVSEHVIRAITIRLIRRSRGEAAAAAALREELSLGYSYLPRLVKALETYEASRPRYRTIAHFYPELLAALE